MKSLLTAVQLEKSYGDKTLFQIPKLEIFESQRIGLVGVNGCGKTTLLHILAGESTPESGVISRRCEIALLRQPGISESDINLECGNYDDGYAFLPKGPGKSGGEQTRIAIAAALSRHTPLLFADEPANNLDMDGVVMLQEALLNYSGSIVLVSHDRSLLDAVCTTIWVLENGTLRIFPGNYSNWMEQRERERAFAQYEFEEYRREKSRLTTEMRNIRQAAQGMLKAPRRMGNSEARLYKDIASIQQKHVQSRAKAMRKRIDQLDEKKRPPELPQIQMQANSTGVVSRIAVRVSNVTLSHGNHIVQKEVSFTLPVGSKTVLLGANGCGKTTLAEAIWQEKAGITIAPGLRIGSFSQTHALLDPEKTVLENARADSTLSEGEVRTMLANLLLPEADVMKPVAILSGGERAKTAFARLLASPCGLMILDEPTNHIDFFTAEALERLLCQWSGTLLLITHDRRLAQKVGDRLLFMEKKTGIQTFEGNWEEWEKTQKPRNDSDLERLMEQMRRAAAP